MAEEVTNREGARRPLAFSAEGIAEAAALCKAAPADFPSDVVAGWTDGRGGAAGREEVAGGGREAADGR